MKCPKLHIQVLRQAKYGQNRSRKQEEQELTARSGEGGCTLTVGQGAYLSNPFQQAVPWLESEKVPVAREGAPPRRRDLLLRQAVAAVQECTGERERGEWKGSKLNPIRKKKQ